MQDKEVSLMFSGGVDSTITAITLAEQYRHVHLLTYGNAHGHYHMERSAKRAEELNAKFGNKFTHRLIPIEDLFRQMVLDTLEEDYKKYGSGFIWCLGCKMTMHTRSIMYDLTYGIQHACDGSSQDTDEMVEQMVVSITLIKQFYEKNGIDFSVPTYTQPRSEKRKMLKELKFNMGIPVGDRYIGIQPRCIPGELYYLPYLIFNKALGHDRNKVIQFIEEKQQIAERYLKEHLNHG